MILVCLDLLVLFRDFSFSPACRLRIDYEAKHLKSEHQGPLIGFLMGMTTLKKTELVLKELHVEKGFLGFSRCAQVILNNCLKRCAKIIF